MKNTEGVPHTAGGSQPPRAVSYMSISLVSVCKHSNYTIEYTLGVWGRQPHEREKTSDGTADTYLGVGGE